MCHSPRGDLIWIYQENNEFPFDLAVADIDGDGLDETLAVTAGGRLLVLDHTGAARWIYRHPVPLYQVCVLSLPEHTRLICAGGVDGRVLFFCPDGVLRNTVAFGRVIRHLRGGIVSDAGYDQLAIATTTGGLSGDLSLILFDPQSMTRLWEKEDLGVRTANSGKRFFSMALADLDNDGFAEIILSASWGDRGLLYGFDRAGNQVLAATANDAVPRVPYRMNRLVVVRAPDGRVSGLVGVFANILVLYKADGSFDSIVESSYDFSGGCFDTASGTLYLGSSPSGGDGVYAISFKHADWKNAFRTITPIGRLAEVERNLDELRRRVADFRMPSYQPEPGKPRFLSHGSSSSSIPVFTYTQIAEDGALWCRHRDKRMPHDMSASRIIEEARCHEREGREFALWAGHGKAVYASPETFNAILEAAPATFQCFIFAEMEHIDDDFREVVAGVLIPLAERCKKYGKKIIFRNKNVYWAGTCYTEYLQRFFFDPRFRDVFIPSMEETNCRTQELSLAGRVGLWLAGRFDHWAARAVTDNAAFDRMWEWSSQQTLSHQIRQLCLRAALGADHFLLDVFQDRYSDRLLAQLEVVSAMIAGGAIVVPQREDLLSVSPLCLGMRNPPDPRFIASGMNGHRYDFPADAAEPRVFDRLDAYWGAAPLRDHDFSSYGFGLRRRMLNFLPECPYGLVCVVPDDADLEPLSWFHEKVSTDGAYFYDEEGRAVSPVAYKPIMLRRLEDAASRLPVRVSGGVAWTAARLDPRHLRVMLLDSGYTDPAPRQARIVLQNVQALCATDLLSGAALSAARGVIEVAVPAGSLVIIDVETKNDIQRSSRGAFPAHLR